MSFDTLEGSLAELRAQLGRARDASDYKQVGHQSRELLITIAEAVFDPQKHQPAGAGTISRTDAKAMFDGYISKELPGNSLEETRRLARAAVDMANAVQHDRAATLRDAQLAVEGCASVLRIVAILAEETLRPEVPWQGVTVKGRHFAWEGPNLHGLVDRPPVAAPDEVVDAIKAHGHGARYGTKVKLRHHLGQGWLPVWETDRHSWRKELLYSSDPDQILLVKPAT